MRKRLWAASTARPTTILGLLALALSATHAPCQAPSPTLPAFFARYECAVADRLRRAHDWGDPKKEEDRYLILSLPRWPGAYVQCVVKDGITRMLCEAASGYFLDGPDEPRTMVLAPDEIAALGRLGFTTVEHNDNFHQEFAVPDPPDYHALAKLMLTALHDGYGARAADEVTFDAPLAPADPAACRPVG